MKSIDELRTLVEQELLSLKYPSTPADLYAPIDYILSLGGKRMRPILLLLSYHVFEKFTIPKASSSNHNIIGLPPKASMLIASSSWRWLLLCFHFEQQHVVT